MTDKPNSRYGDFFKPTRRHDRDTWDSTQPDNESFGEWIRRSRTPSGMDPDEQALADALQRHQQCVNEEAERQMDARLNPHPNPSSKE